MKKNYLILNVIPILIHLIFLPFWFSKNEYVLDNVKIIEIGYHFIYCLGILVLNFIYSFKQNKGIIFPNLLIMIILIPISAFMLFFNYWIKTGNYIHFYYEDTFFLSLLIEIPVIIVILCCIIYEIFFRITKCIYRNSESGKNNKI
jgi:hypothetical protein